MKYTKKDFRWATIYSLCHSMLSGANNSFTNYFLGKGQYFGAFYRATRNSFVASMIIGTFYTKLINSLCESKHAFLYSNLASIGLSSLMIGWHHVAGTDNPFIAPLPNIVLGLILTNVQVSKEVNGLEEVVKENPKHF